MALVVETGSGADPLANSYASDDDARTYLTNTGRIAGTWQNTARAQREAFLVLATQYMAARWNLRWMGIRSNEDQPLDWPRFDTFKRSGFVFQSDEMPPEVNNAQIEYALIEANDPGQLFGSPEYDPTRRNLTGISEKVDVIEESRTFSDTTISPTTWRKYPIADNLIAHLTGSAAVKSLLRQ